MNQLTSLRRTKWMIENILVARTISDVVPALSYLHYMPIPTTAQIWAVIGIAQSTEPSAPPQEWRSAKKPSQNDGENLFSPTVQIQLSQ